MYKTQTTELKNLHKGSICIQHDTYGLFLREKGKWEAVKLYWVSRLTDSEVFYNWGLKKTHKIYQISTEIGSKVRQNNKILKNSCCDFISTFFPLFFSLS
jgi:Mn-dependent DtxR family transcriptional regulator